MEVILLADVKSLGKKGDTVKVSDGYGRNYLLAKGLGTEATQGNLNTLRQKKLAEEKEQQRIKEEAQALAEEIGKKTVVIRVKTGEGGKLFGAISGKEIVKEAEKQFGLVIDKKKLVMEDSIRNLGTTLVPVKLHKDVTATLAVKVCEEA